MVFCSWGAEEYGLIGSFEWTQQFAKVLGQRAVAYLNVDTAVGGEDQLRNFPDWSWNVIMFFGLGNQTLYGNAFPTLQKLLVESSKMIPNPNPSEIEAGRKTVFDTWLKNSPDPNNSNQPK